MEKFGPSCKNGDTIGVLLEFKANGQGELTVFKNGASIGKLYDDIPAGEYFPCLSINRGSNVATLNSKARMPQWPFRNYHES